MEDHERQCQGCNAEGTMSLDIEDQEQNIRVLRCRGCGALAVIEDPNDEELTRWYRRVQ